MRVSLLLPILVLPLTGGCVKTIAGVAAAPFKAGGQVVDWTTTSQDEADRNYARKMRKQDAAEGRARRDWEKKCKKDRANCKPYDGYRAGYPK